MANPAVKNGFTPIANELIEQLARHSISGSEMRILWTVWRKTWGWSNGSRKKDWDWISISQFEKMTGMKRSNCVSATKSLVVKRLLLKGENGLKFNQNYDEWGVVKRLPPVVKRIRGSSQTTTKGSSQTTTHKRKKETNTKETNTPANAGDEKFTHNPLGAEVLKEFESVDPKNSTYYNRRPQREACDFLLETYGLEKTKQAIALLTKTNKWPYFPKVYTPIQLKENWQALSDAFQRKNGEQIIKGRGLA